MNTEKTLPSQLPQDPDAAAPGSPAPRARRRRSKRGSVLILVVSLLVLMALIGTAWISSTRVDRASTVQNTHNTQIDLLVDGVVNTIRATLVADLFDQGLYRRAGGKYDHSDGVLSDEFLASRVPVLRDEVATVWHSGFPGAVPPIPPPTYVEGQWVQHQNRFYVCLGTHLGDSGEEPGGSSLWAAVGNSFDVNQPFDVNNPPVYGAVSRILPPGAQFEDIFGSVPSWTTRNVVQPEVVGKPSPPAPAGQDPEYPAMTFFHPGLDAVVTVIAGDTDGDGAADAFLYKLPVGRLNGLDYYAAIRIVDNNSAINASTAFGPATPGAGAVASYPSSVNLVSLLIGMTGRDIRDQTNRLQRTRLTDDPRDDMNGAPFNFPPFDVPLNDLLDTVPNRRRPDFAYATIEELIQIQLARRLGNPGEWTDGDNTPLRMKALPAADLAALLFRGGTLVNPDAMNPDLSPSSTLEMMLGQTLYYSAANHPSSSSAMARQSSYPLNDRQTPMKWFGRNFDYRQLWTTEQTADPQTWRNRRALLTAYNPLSAAVPERFLDKRVWDDSGYDVGDWVRHTRNSKTMQFVCINPQPRRAGREPFMPQPSVPISHPSRIPRAWEPQVFETYPTKASVNAASFGRLFLAYWQAMGESSPLIASPPMVQNPFKDALHALILGTPSSAPQTFHDPYIGRHFIAGVVGAPVPMFPPAAPAPLVATQIEHPLRMFASPVRVVPPPGAAAAAWSETTPRLFQDDTMRLRAALAAVNAMDMRDNDDEVTFQDVALRVSLDTGSDEELEGDSGDVAVFARARVYGHERQPFLTEVYANTSNAAPTGGTANLFGYVAIELYNPHPYPISLFNCRLATIDRRSTSAASDVPAGNLVVNDYVSASTLAPAALSVAVSNLAGGAAFMPPYVVPANGYLVLENYSAGPPPPGGAAAPATHRPASTGMPPAGPIPDPDLNGTEPVRNFAYLPNLHTVIDKEMVLLRPLSAVSAPPPTVSIDGDAVACILYAASPAETGFAVDMVPLDSFDFTGLPNRDPAVTPAYPAPITRAYAWHYSRPSGAAKQWRFVYPGRYDASQSLDIAAVVPRPRHQGTFEAGFAGPPAALGWDPTAGAAPQTKDPWDPTPPVVGVHPQPLPSFVNVPTLGTPTPDASFGLDNEHPIQLSTSLLANAGASGPFPTVGAGPYQYPFGGFARNGDALNVPFIGAYRIKLTHWTLAGREYSNAEHVVEPGEPNYSMVFELNAITMDSAMAEDTDPDNHPRAGDTPATRTEQIGRFAPSLDDLQPDVLGTVDGMSNVSPVEATLTDNERSQDPGDGGDRWNGYEIEIVAGPGKGQIRQVVDYAPGTFTVFRAWDVGLGPESKYVLRKGPLWRFVNPNIPASSPANYGGRGAYRWARDLLEYVTVDAPQDDHFPPADPMSYGNVGNDPPPPQAVNNTSMNFPAAVTYGRMVGGGAGRFTGTDNLINRDQFYMNGAVEFLTGLAAGEVAIITGYRGNSREIQVSPSLSTAPAVGDVFRIFHTPEDTTPLHGLININTAPWPVLATLPMFPENPAANATLAQAIARWRDGDPSAGLGANGPFKSVFDLYKVPEFRLVQEQLLLAIGDVDDGSGDFTPQGQGAVDNVRHDHEENFLLANRISNMVTTRSDTFTCYVLVQGWRGAGTSNPELVVQRRRAFVADRSGVAPMLKEVPLQYFYNE